VLTFSRVTSPPPILLSTLKKQAVRTEPVNFESLASYASQRADVLVQDIEWEERGNSSTRKGNVRWEKCEITT